MIEYELFDYNKHLLKTHVYCGSVFKSLKWEDDGMNWRWSISPMHEALWASNANDRNVTCKMVWTEMLEVWTLSQGMLIFQYGNETAVTTYKESSLWLCNKCSFLPCRGWGISVSITEKVTPALVDYLMALWLFNYSSIGGIAWRKVDSAKSAKHNWVSPHAWANASFSKVDWLLGDYKACCYWLLFLKNRASWYLFTLGSLLLFFKGRLISCKLWNCGY
jgi:hypothetical protein